jgi:hypothetical protein
MHDSGLSDVLVCRFTPPPLSGRAEKATITPLRVCVVPSKPDQTLAEQVVGPVTEIRMTAAQVNSQETEPAYVAGYSAIPWPVQRGTIQFVDRNGKRRRLSKTEIAVGAALYSCVNAPMGDKKKRQSEVGSPLVKPKQEYVCQIADVSQPTLWRALDSLARAGLISHKLIRDSKGKVRGCIYDLTNWLLLLPQGKKNE